MKNKISQTATEYLILLAVVIVVALVVVNAMGVFPGIGSSSNKKISDQKLASDVVGVTSYFIGDSYSIFNLKNNNYDTITVTEFRINQQANLTCNSSNTIPALPAVLNIGQSVTINCSVVNTSSYTLSDRKTPLIGILYIDSLGATRLAGNVLTYGEFSLAGGGSNSSSIISGPTNGLVAYYSFDSNMSDISGNGNNGNCTGATCPTLNGSGVIGSAYAFDGSNDYINTSIDTELDSSQNFSVFGWFYSKNYVGGIRSFFSKTDGSSNEWSLIQHTAYPLELDIVSSTSCGAGASNHRNNVANLKINQWQFIGITKVGTNISYYVDGVYINSLITVIPMCNKTFQMGINANTNYPFNGSIDEVRVYNRTLNSSEVSDLYNLGMANASRVLAMDFNSNGLNYLNLNYSNSSLYLQGMLIRDNSIYNNSGNSSGLTKQYWWNGNTAGTSVINGSLQFDGVNDYVTIPDSTGFESANQDYTFSTWIKPYDKGGLNQVILSKGTNPWKYLFEAGYVNSTDYRLIIYDYNGGAWRSNSAAYTLKYGEWSQVGFVSNISAGNITFFANGVLQSSVVYNSSVSTAGVAGRLGAYTSGYYFNGSMDDAIFWGRALNATEINTVYNEGLAGRTSPVDFSPVPSRTIPATNQIGYWSFNINQSGNATDSWNGLNGNCSEALYSSCPTWSSIGYNQSGTYYFNKTQYDYISSPSISSYNISTLTWCVWVNQTRLPAAGSYIEIFSKSGTNSRSSFGLSQNSSGDWLMEGAYNSVYGNPLRLNKWYFLCGAYNGTTGKAYQNGVLVRTGTVTDITVYYNNSRNLIIGSYDYDTLRGFDGYLDELMIFNKTLNSTEILGLYDQGREILHLPLDELSGNVSFSLDGNYPGNLTNYPTTATSAPIWNATGGVNGSGAYEFDGIDDYLEMINQYSPGTNDFTLSAFINAKNTTSTKGILGETFAGGGARYGIFILNGYVYALIERVNGIGKQTYTPISTNTNYLVTAVFDRDANLSLYINGFLNTTIDISDNVGNLSPAPKLRIGSYNGGGGTPAPMYFFNGTIDNPQIFDRALSASEVLALYNSP